MYKSTLSYIRLPGIISWSDEEIEDKKGKYGIFSCIHGNMQIKIKGNNSWSDNVN